MHNMQCSNARAIDCSSAEGHISSDKDKNKMTRQDVVVCDVQAAVKVLELLPFFHTCNTQDSCIRERPTKKYLSSSLKQRKNNSSLVRNEVASVFFSYTLYTIYTHNYA